MTNNSEDCAPGYFPTEGTANESVERDISSLFGWAYFVCWSVCFYPQIILNYKRKSVIGFHFDFLFLNVIGKSYSSLLVRFPGIKSFPFSFLQVTFPMSSTTPFCFTLQQHKKNIVL